jgi:hypothetical protein
VLFTPLFALMLAAATVVRHMAGLGDAFDRDVSVFDALSLSLAARPLRHVRPRPSTTPD